MYTPRVQLRNPGIPRGLRNQRKLLTEIGYDADPRLLEAPACGGHGVASSGVYFLHLDVWRWQRFQSQLRMLRLPQSIARALSSRVSSSISIRVAGMVILAACATLFSPGAHGLTQQLTCTPTGLNFGNVTVDQSETQLLLLKNSGHTTVTVSAMKVSGGEFSVSHVSMPLHLAGGASVTLSVKFAPTATGWTGGRLTFTSNLRASTLQVGLEGAGVSSEELKVNPTSITFGQVALGSSAKLPLVLTNERSWQVRLLKLSAEGNGFSVTGPSLPLTLKPRQSVKLEVNFAPAITGLVGGSISVLGPGIEVPLEGTGTQASAGQLHISPQPLAFGDVPVGTMQTQTITLSATVASVIVSSATSSSSQFVLEGASFPLTIAAGKGESFHVAFTPKGSGSVSGTLTFASNAANSPTQESMTGTGTVTPYTVSLSWNASTSSVVGYNVYRGGAASGPFKKINSALDANTAYQDSTVVSGNTYYYAATAVGSDGKESALSTPVEAVVP